MTAHTVYFLLALAGVLYLSEACPAECTCVGVSVACRHTPMNTFPAGVPSETEVLIIKGTYSEHSEFHHVGKNDLSTFKTLKSLTVSHTMLDTVDEKAFQDSKTLTAIDLSFNRLTNLPAGVFAGLTSLAMLHLTGNEHLHLPGSLFNGLHNLVELYLSDLALSSLDLDLFSGLDNLLFLDLSNNNLKALPSGVVSTSFLRSLQHLDLSYNRFTYLSNDTAPLMTRVKRIVLSNNPWLCTCELQWMQRFRSQIFPALPSHEVVYCEGPEDVAYTAMARLSPQQFVCVPPRIVHCDAVDPQQIGATFHIHCNMTGLPFPFILWKTADGSVTYGSTRDMVGPQLTVEDNQVTITVMATRAVNGTLTIVAQNVYGAGTEKINIYVQNPTTTTRQTTTTTTTTTTPTTRALTTSTKPGTVDNENEKKSPKEEVKGDGGAGILMYAAAGGGGVALLISAIVTGVACCKMKKAKVQPQRGTSSNENDRRNTDNKQKKNEKRNDDDDDVDEFGTEERNYGANMGRRPPTSTHPLPAWDI